ncbi:hypothetical protein [Ferruginibacter albus]|uniref:hypothetical protein n=1 Tax=Ferruginibacter albus TaxID=2875540 RepID=UPI001CC62872|nr:hypothetical protein [Ferruginibacter albus]UAY50722.1 hypothetical protein K9M53_08950 [Ferruginibacter albus]
MFYLDEEKPITINADHLPIKIIANNGYHSSKPLLIETPVNAPLYIEVGCTADNLRLWVALIASILFFTLFFITGMEVLLILANIPFIYLMYRFFGNHKEFITISVLKIGNKK